MARGPEIRTPCHGELSMCLNMNRMESPRMGGGQWRTLRRTGTCPLLDVAPSRRREAERRNACSVLRKLCRTWKYAGKRFRFFHLKKRDLGPVKIGFSKWNE